MDYEEEQEEKEEEAEETNSCHFPKNQLILVTAILNEASRCPSRKLDSPHQLDKGLHVESWTMIIDGTIFQFL